MSFRGVLRVGLAVSGLSGLVLACAACSGDVDDRLNPSGTGAGGDAASTTTGSSQGGGDTSSSSSGGGGGAPVDPCLDRTICEDFEGVAVGEAPGAPFEVHDNGGTVAVDDTRAASGARSLKVHIDATTAGDTYRQAMLAVTGAPLIPLPGNTVYGRFMISTDRIPDSSVHWTIAHGDGPQGAEWATYNYGGMGGLMANYYRNTSPLVTDCWQTKDEMFPTTGFACVAFMFDGTNDEMRFWLDGVEIPELHVVGMSKTDMTCTESPIDGKWYAPDFTNIAVGWESYQHDTAGAHDAWIDDLILDDAPIACP